MMEVQVPTKLFLTPHIGLSKFKRCIFWLGRVLLFSLMPASLLAQEPSRDEIVRYIEAQNHPLVRVGNINYRIFEGRQRGTGRVSVEGQFVVSEDLFVNTFGSWPNANANSHMFSAVVDRGIPREFLLYFWSRYYYWNIYSNRTDIQEFLRVFMKNDVVKFSAEIQYFAKVSGFDFDGRVESGLSRGLFSEVEAVRSAEGDYYFVPSNLFNSMVDEVEKYYIEYNEKSAIVLDQASDYVQRRFDWGFDKSWPCAQVVLGNSFGAPLSINKVWPATSNQPDWRFVPLDYSNAMYRFDFERDIILLQMPLERGEQRYSGAKLYYFTEGDIRTFDNWASTQKPSAAVVNGRYIGAGNGTELAFSGQCFQGRMTNIGVRGCLSICLN